jgi:hypothetical protein
VVMVTLTTGIMVLLFTSVHFRVRGIFYEGGPRVRRPLKEWSGIVASLRNADLGDQQ